MPYIFFSNVIFAVQAAQDVPDGSILQFNKALLIQMLIQGFNILLLTVVLIFILYKPVKKFMDSRSERIKNDMESARSNNETAQELKEKYETLIRNVENEREAILREAHQIAVEKSDRILLAARKEAKHMLKKAEDEIKVERENAAEDMKRQIIEISTLMATRFVEVSMDDQTQNRYIEESMSDWSEQTWQE